jgi:hypothetical protein
LSQTQFCFEQRLNPKYFSQKRNAALGESRSSFIKVMMPPQPDLSNAIDQLG